MDISSNLIVKTLNTGKSPAGLYLSEQKKLFVANKDDNTVSVFNINNFEEEKVISVGKAPYGVSQLSTNYIFVTNVQSTPCHLLIKII